MDTSLARPPRSALASAFAALAAATLFVVPVAFAQFPGGGGSGGGMPGRGMPSGGGAKEASMQRRGDEARPAQGHALPMASLVQSRLAELRSDLLLSAAQMPAWDRYSQAVLRLLDDITRVGEMSVPSDLNAPQRLEQLADLARNRLTATEDVVDAGKALYATLTPPQRAIADRFMAEAARPLFGARVPGGAGAAGDRGGPPGGDGGNSPRGGGPR